MGNRASMQQRAAEEAACAPAPAEAVPEGLGLPADSCVALNDAQSPSPVAAAPPAARGPPELMRQVTPYQRDDVWKARKTSLVIQRRRSVAAAPDEDNDDDLYADDDFEDYADDAFEPYDEGDDARAVSRTFAATLAVDAAPTDEFRRRSLVERGKYGARRSVVQTTSYAQRISTVAGNVSPRSPPRPGNASSRPTAEKAVSFARTVQLRFFEKVADTRHLHYSEEEIDVFYGDTCAETKRGWPIGGYDTEDRPHVASSTDCADAASDSDSDASDAPPRISKLTATPA